MICSDSESGAAWVVFPPREVVAAVEVGQLLFLLLMIIMILITNQC